MHSFVFTLTYPGGNTATWRTDGSAAGTVELSSTGTGAVTKPGDFVFWGDNLLLNSGAGLFVANSTGSTTQLGTGNPTSYIPFGNLAIFASSNPGQPWQLYESTGTAAGTQLVLFPNGLQTITGPFLSLGNRIAFTGDDGSSAAALFVTDGTGPGSRELSRLFQLGLGGISYAPAGGSSVLTGAGSDTISASGAASIIGGAGSATIFGGNQGGIYTGGAKGANILISRGASGANTTLAGAVGGDELFGSASGSDTLTIGKGRETAVGGGGTTTIDGGQSGSVIFTGGGQTTVNGGFGGGDTIVGGQGALAANAAYGDAVFGGRGTLTAVGSSQGADSIVGGAGAMSVTGQGANMLVVAGTGANSINTGNGASLIYAGSGSTTVTGGSGSMQVVIGSGTGHFTEAAGRTVYDVVHGSAGGTDIITGFKPGSDQIQLFNYGSTAPTVTVSGGSTMLSLADGTRITIAGVTDIGNSIVG